MRKLNIICLLFMIAIRVCAQTDSVVISKSQLCGTRWEQTFPSSKYSSDEIMFKDSVIVDNVYFRSMDERVMNSFEYYITDKLPSYSVFYRKYVGQERTGCYIVEYNSKVKRVDYYIVVSLTEKELVLYHRATPGQIPNLDTYIKYRRIDENKNYPDSLMATISLHAQNFHKENLVGKKWKIDNLGSCIEFSETKIDFWLGTKHGSSLMCENDYYLSENIDSVFDKQKIGRLQTGRYIIVYENLKQKKKIVPKISVFEIIDLTPTKLQIRSKENDIILIFYNLPDEEVPMRAKFRPDIR